MIIMFSDCSGQNYDPLAGLRHMALGSQSDYNH